MYLIQLTIDIGTLFRHTFNIYSKGENMNINKALSLAKNSDDKRIAFNLKIPSILKKEFESFCKKNDVKVTAMILALMQTALDENLKGEQNVETISSLQSTIMTMNELIENNVDESDVGFNPIVVKKAVERKLNILAGINPDEE